jgi:hypothetical protein
MKKVRQIITMAALTALFPAPPLWAQAPVVLSVQELDRPFGSVDREAFQSPPMVYHPETWFHFIGGNVAKKGITADLEAIAAAGLSGMPAACF